MDHTKQHTFFPSAYIHCLVASPTVMYQEGLGQLPNKVESNVTIEISKCLDKHMVDARAKHRPSQGFCLQVFKDSDVASTFQTLGFQTPSIGPWIHLVGKSDIHRSTCLA